MNQIEAIKEAARKEAECRRKRDEAGAKFHRDWAVRAIRLEDDIPAAREAYQQAYRDYIAQFDFPFSR